MLKRTIAKRARQGLPDDPEDFKATLGEHLEELRTRIIRVITFLVVAWVAGWYLQPYVYDFIQATINKEIRGNASFVTEVLHNAADAFLLKLRLSFMIALTFSVPFAILQLWGFIKPGLKPAERKVVTSVAPWTAVLFLMGAGFCWLVLPQAIHWFLTYFSDFPGVKLYQEAGTMAFFALKMVLAFGIAFQLPLIVYILGRIGILSPDTLLKYWRHATTTIFVVAMIITPSNDPGSMLMMAIPLTVLFMISVYLVKWTVKPRAQEELEARETEPDALD